MIDTPPPRKTSTRLHPNPSRSGGIRVNPRFNSPLFLPQITSQKNIVTKLLTPKGAPELQQACKSQ